MSQNSNYDPFIPQSTQKFSAWQPPMLVNFEELFTAFAVNHIQMASVVQPSQTEQGKHTFVDMLQGTGNFETNANQVNIFTKLDGNNVSQLWVKFLSNQNETQYTACENINYTPKITQSSLPGPFVIFSGTWVTNGANPTSIPVTSPGQGKPLCALVYSNSTGTTGPFIYTTLQNNSVTVNFTQIGGRPIKVPSSIYYIIFCELAK